jgi:hypothetical protein
MGRYTIGRAGRSSPMRVRESGSTGPVRVRTLPLDVFLLAVGAQAEKALARNLHAAT